MRTMLRNGMTLPAGITRQQVDSALDAVVIQRKTREKNKPKPAFRRAKKGWSK